MRQRGDAGLISAPPSIARRLASRVAMPERAQARHSSASHDSAAVARGTTPPIMSPLEFMQRLTADVPTSRHIHFAVRTPQGQLSDAKSRAPHDGVGVDSLR